MHRAAGVPESFRRERCEMGFSHQLFRTSGRAFASGPGQSGYNGSMSPSPQLPAPFEDEPRDNDLPVSVESAGERDVLLCPGCLTANTDSAEFCAQCGMPIGHISTIDPIQRITAQGWLYRRALHARPRPIVLAGMWLIFAPMVLGQGLFLRDLPHLSQRGYPQGPLLLTVISVLLCVAFTVLYGTILYRMTEHYLSWQPRRCPSCDEELDDPAASACPECGAAIKGPAPEPEMT